MTDRVEGGRYFTEQLQIFEGWKCVVLFSLRFGKQYLHHRDKLDEYVQYCLVACRILPSTKTGFPVNVSELPMDELEDISDVTQILIERVGKQQTPDKFSIGGCLGSFLRNDVLPLLGKNLVRKHIPA